MNPRRDGILYSASLVLPRLPAFLLLPVYAARLSLAEMGVLATCWIFMELFQALASLGMRQAVGRFFPLADSLPKRRQVLTTALAVTFAGGAATALLSFLAFSLPALRARLEFFDSIDAKLLLLLLLASALGNLSNTLVVYFRAERRPWAFLLAGASGAAIEAGIALSLLATDSLTVPNLLAAECAKQAVILLLVAWQGRRDLVPAYSGETWGTMARFAVWLVPVSLLDWTAISADRFWLGQLAGMDPVGVYGFFARLVTPLAVLFSGALMEMHSRLYAMQGAGGQEFLARRLDRFLVAGGAACVALSLLFPPAFRWAAGQWPGLPAGYVAGVHVFPLLLAVMYAQYWGKYYGAALEYAFRTRAVLFGLGLSAAVAMALTPVLLHAFRDPLVAAAAAALAAVLAGMAAMAARADLGGFGSGTRRLVSGGTALAGCLASYLLWGTV